MEQTSKEKLKTITKLITTTCTVEEIKTLCLSILKGLSELESKRGNELKQMGE